MHSGTPRVNPTPSKPPQIRASVSQSSFTSDRLPPKPQQQKQKGSGNSNKQARDPPKNLEVKRLESVLSVLRSLSVDGPLNEKGPDPKGGCFCQGEKNPPSLDLHPDSFRVQIQPLIARIEAEIRDQLAKEEAERVLAKEELRMREGEFPMLRPSPSPSPSPSPGLGHPSNTRPGGGGGSTPNHPQKQGYTVLSLTSGRGGKRQQVTMASYRPGNISKSSSSSSLRKDAEVDEVVRIRCPPSQVKPIKAL